MIGGCKKVLSSVVIVLFIVAAVVENYGLVAATTVNEYQFLSEQEIMYYLPESVDITGSYSGGNPCGGIFTGELATADEKGAIIAGLLKSEGYSDVAIAGILGNLKAESSGFNNNRLEGKYPSNRNIVQNGITVVTDYLANEHFVAHIEPGGKTYSGGFGIVQWTSAGRVKNLQAHADNKGLPVNSFDAQVSFLAFELSTGYGITPDMLNAFSLERVTYEIWSNYETPGASFAGSSASAALQTAYPRTSSGHYLHYPFDDLMAAASNPSHILRTERADVSGNSTKTPYDSYNDRLDNAKGFLGIEAADVSGSAGNCNGSGNFMLSPDGNYAYPIEVDKVTSYGLGGDDASGGHPYYAIDLMSPSGTNVFAFRRGEVKNVHGIDEWGEQAITILGDDKYIYYYTHLTAGSIQVAIGDSVEAGDHLATVGPSGQGTSPHLHFDITKSKALGGMYESARGTMSRSNVVQEYLPSFVSIKNTFEAVFGTVLPRQ